MLHIDPKDKSVGEVFDYLLGGVAPRPIALVSTLSEDGQPNLAPFSFFNAFGGNPPTVAFSPSRRRRDATTKDTYHNLMATKECVIHAVTYDIVQQVNLASGEFDAGVNEFEKSGLTPVPSDIVKPARVAESPFQMECVLNQIVNLGDGPGSGNLAICEVVRFHIDERVFDNKGVIDPQLIDLVGRNSARYWTRAHGDAIITVAAPLGPSGIGWDNLPEYVRQSKKLTANDVARLANYAAIPSDDEVVAYIKTLAPFDADESVLKKLLRRGEYETVFSVALAHYKTKKSDVADLMESAAAIGIKQEQIDFAWKAMAAADMVRKKKL